MRILGVPLAWFPRLLSASPDQRRAVEISAFGPGPAVHRFALHRIRDDEWQAHDEAISVAGLLAGRGDSTLSPRGRGWPAEPAG